MTRHDGGNESNRKRRRHRNSPTESESESSSASFSGPDDSRRSRKRKGRRECKHKNYKRVKKDRRKRRQRDDDEETAASDDEQQVRAEETSKRHKYHRKKTDDRHAQKQGMKKAVEERCNSMAYYTLSLSLARVNFLLHPIPKLKALSEEDYFLKNNEFSTWLKKERGIFFSNLSSEGARMLFLEFVSAWNSGKLHSDYYEGMSSAPRTDHNWGLKGINKTLSEGVMDPIEERKIAKNIKKSKREKFQKMQEVVLDELLPKVTESERMLSKKSLNREKSRARKDSPELIKEKDLLGGGNDFHARLHKESKRRQKKEMEISAVFAEKLQASRQEEAEAMNQLQAILNNSGGKITIPKRN